MTSDRGSKRITVLAPTAIVKRQDHEDRTRVYHEIQEDSLPWTNCERQLRKAGWTHIKKNSTKELRPSKIAQFPSQDGLIAPGNTQCRNGTITIN